LPLINARRQTLYSLALRGRVSRKSEPEPTIHCSRFQRNMYMLPFGM